MGRSRPYVQIDLLSYATYLKCEGKNYRKENPQVKTVVLHLDNDKAGRLAALTLKELLKKDYEIVDAPPPAGKDVNDFLMSYLGIAKKNECRERRDAR